MFPLTSAQRGVWFDQLLHPEEPLYNMGGYLRIDGAIDEVVFEASLRTLVDRHDALRIVLRNTGDDVPQQEFLHDVDFDLPWLDLSAEEDPDAAAMAWMRARLDTPFALFDAPLFDFAMLRLAPDRIVWFHKYHHIVFDAWSHSLVVQDLARIYASLLEGAAPPDTPHSYRDAIEDDQKYLQSPAFAADAEYWRERFAAHPEPVIERKSFGDSIAHERAVLVLPRGFYDRIEMLAKENGASTFHVIVAALYIYFTRIARREDLAIGLPTLNRGSAALKRTAGLFAALIPFWLQQPHDVTTVALLQEIGRKLRRDYRHLRLPIAEINRIAGLHKHGRVQLFDIVVTYQKQSYDVEFGGAPVEQFSLRHGAEQTPLAVEISEYNEQLDVRVNIDYSLTAFTAEEIAAFQRRLVHLLEEMVDAPSKAIGDLELLPPDERDAMLARGRRVCTFAPEETLVERFESQVRRTPHAKAVAYDAQSLTQSLTYDELNRRANQLARHLQSQGAGPGTRVAICLERSLDLVIAILGVLKCGAAYVPLEPSDPPERRAFIVTDSGADVILTHSRTPGGPSPDAALILRVDTDSDVIAACEDGDLALHREPSAPAYLIYTSGSTGRPKGTLVTHHNVVRLFLASQRLYRFDASDVWTLFHSTAFDFSVWEIFGALLHGGTLVV
ncbi:MAG TPA: condensation domain-containing protein, partial [Thermoanaerobaculia bacterium]|nr:condensation domain-containing protein [Thermoanaerobaculia bacterium]